MICASCASDIFWTTGDRRSGTFMLFPTCEPLPSRLWHMAHFVRNVAVLATLSGPRLARTTQETKSVRPKKKISRNIIEANIACRSVLSFVTALPLPNFSLQLRTLLHHHHINPRLSRRRITSAHCRWNPDTHVFPFAESPPKNLAPALRPIASHRSQKQLPLRAFVRQRHLRDRKSTRNPCSLAESEIAGYSRSSSLFAVCPRALERPLQSGTTRPASDCDRDQLSHRARRLRQSPAFLFPVKCSPQASWSLRSRSARDKNIFGRYRERSTRRRRSIPCFRPRT